MAIHVTGLPALQRDFSNLTAKMQRAVLRDALRSSARVVVKEAKLKVPTDTKRLQKSIGHRVSVKSRGAAEATIGFGKERFYGRFVELGTSKMAARPFLRPALDESQGKIERAFVDAVNRGIERKTLQLEADDG